MRFAGVIHTAKANTVDAVSVYSGGR